MQDFGPTSYVLHTGGEYISVTRRQARTLLRNTTARVVFRQPGYRVVQVPSKRNAPLQPGDATLSVRTLHATLRGGK